MNKLGELLKRERELKKLSLEDVRKLTKIPIHSLQAIEEGDHEKLPARPFVRGFVKVYCQVLDLDWKATRSLFETEFGGSDVVIDPQSVRAPTEDVAPPPKESILWFQAPKPVFMLLGFLFISILCFFIYLALHKIQGYENEIVGPQAPSSIGLSPTASPSHKPQDIQQTENPSLKGLSPTKKNPSAETTSSMNGAKKPSESLKKNDSSNKVAKKVEDQKTTAIQISEKQQESLSKLNTKPKPLLLKPKPVIKNRLSVFAFETVRLEIVWSTGKPQVFLLKSNETKHIVFSKKVTLRLSDGGVVNLKFNKKELGVPGTIRKPIELTFP